MAKIKIKKDDTLTTHQEVNQSENTSTKTNIHINENIKGEDTATISKITLEDNKPKITETDEKEKKPINVAMINEMYSDDIFNKIKNVSKEKEFISRGIKIKQYGKRLYFYQGNTSNNWGVIEAREGKPHYIRIMNSYLLKLLKSNPITKEIFKEIL
jgi:hypothetical protein